MLAIWPVITISFFIRKDIRTAIVWSMLGGYLLLPVGVSVDLPSLPPLDKYSITTISVLLCLFLIKKKRLRPFSLKGIALVLFVMMLIAPFITSYYNQGPYLHLPGLTQYDALTASFKNILFMSPFFIGRSFLNKPEDQILIFKCISMSIILYSVLILFEIRMSPQLHIWSYGFFPHSFAQQARGDGFRAVVFMGHGLLVSFFVAISLISTGILLKLKKTVFKFDMKWTLFYLFIVLILCKSLASLIYASAIVVAVLHGSPKVQIKLAMLIAIIGLSYPILSIEKLFPHETLIELAESASPERAKSLAYRFKNETVLLDHANEKPFYGWGGWGRNRVYQEETGKDITTTDGAWIITFGRGGWIAFLAEFGLMFLTILAVKRSVKPVRSREEVFLLTSHALVVSVIFIDQLPNASISPFYWLIIGSLFGRIEHLKLQESKTKESGYKNNSGK